MKIATIFHYCTNDYRFLKRLVEECSLFSSQILIPFSDCFFDGKKENRFLLEQSMKENRDCQFIRFEFDVKRLYSPFVHRVPSDEDWLCCWHSTSRYVARFFVNSDIDWIFFLDADEIVEGKRFSQWLQAQLNTEEKAVWFSSYMYGNSASRRKRERQLTGLLMQKTAVNPHQLLHPQERSGIFQDIVGKKRMHVLGLDGLPMIHHYSWVRSKKECIRKMKTWAKKNQRDWLRWLRQESDCLKDYEIVDAYFDPLAVCVPEGTASGGLFPNEQIATRKAILDKELDYVAL